MSLITLTNLFGFLLDKLAWKVYVCLEDLLLEYLVNDFVDLCLMGFEC